MHMALTCCLRVLNRSVHTTVCDWPLYIRTNQCIEDARLAAFWTHAHLLAKAAFMTWAASVGTSPGKMGLRSLMCTCAQVCITGSNNFSVLSCARIDQLLLCFASRGLGLTDNYCLHMAGQAHARHRTCEVGVQKGGCGKGLYLIALWCLGLVGQLTTSHLAAGSGALQAFDAGAPPPLPRSFITGLLFCVLCCCFILTQCRHNLLLPALCRVVSCFLAQLWC